MKATIPPITVKDPNERRLLAAIKEAIEVSSGVIGNPLDRSLTVRDLVDSGLATISTTPTKYIKSTDIYGSSPDALEDLSQPPQPSELAAHKGISSIFLTWGKPSFDNFAHVNVYRAGTDNFSNAVVISNVLGLTHVDYVPYEVLSEITGDIRGYYYWITFVSIAGKEGPPNAVNGVYQEPIKDGDEAIQQLSINRLVGDIASFITANINDASITSAMIAQVIKSDNYDANNGWAINKDGLAVFNNMYARGVIEGSTIRGSIIDGGVFIGGTDVTIPTDIDGGPGAVPRYLCYADYDFYASTSNNAWSSNSSFLPAGYYGQGAVVEGSETLAVNYARMKKLRPKPTLSVNYQGNASVGPGWSNDTLSYSVRVIFRDASGDIHDFNISSSWSGSSTTRTHQDGYIKAVVGITQTDLYNGTIINGYAKHISSLSLTLHTPLPDVGGDSPLDIFVLCRYRFNNNSWVYPSMTVSLEGNNTNL